MSEDEEAPATWGSVIGEAADLLLELADAGFLPEEYEEQGRFLGNELRGIADEMLAD